MSSTNKTLTIELSQYVGTDKPTYLTDYNGDMLKIDNAIAADRDGITTAQGKADGADAKADANATAIQSLDGQINNTSNGLTKRVTDVEGDVNTIESLIGNGTPTTTDKTIIGAINELAAEIPSGTAAGTSYDNTDSGLTATNVQGAIDELAANGGVKRTALWTNANIDTAFAAQNVTLSSGDYDELEIYCARSKTDAKLTYTKTLKGYSAIADIAFTSGNELNSLVRPFTYTDATHYAIGDGLSGVGVSGVSTNNDVMIPVAIYGIKY